MPGGGDFVSFFPTRGPEFCTEKLSPGRGILTEKISGPAVSPGGGMVTGQIDTCISSSCRACMNPPFAHDMAWSTE